jgi:hypothetical protein
MYSLIKSWTTSIEGEKTMTRKICGIRVGNLAVAAAVMLSGAYTAYAQAAATASMQWPVAGGSALDSNDGTLYWGANKLYAFTVP